MIHQQVSRLKDEGPRQLSVTGSSAQLQEMGQGIPGAPRRLNNVVEADGKCAEVDRSLLTKQCLKYAEDLAKIYEEEKGKRKALERANEELSREIQARIRAENGLRQSHLMLEQRVRERTTALASANHHLRTEIDRREQFEAQLKGSLREKEILLSEVHHRVKNNLQIISSLLGLQCMLVDDPRVLDALSDSQNRIRSMAMIHEQLYRSSNLAAINFADYVHGLVSQLIEANSGTEPSITARIKVQETLLPVGMALSCGLIINELVTNSLNHAFEPGHMGEIAIEFHHEHGDTYRLTFSDNGVGLPQDFDWRSGSSLGLQLVLNLAEVQLRGSVEVGSGPGAHFTIGVRKREDL